MTPEQEQKLITTVERLDATVERLDATVARLDTKVERLDTAVARLDTIVEKLVTDVEKFNDRFSDYQQAMQWVVQLAFSLIAAATITIIASKVLGR
ncbi:hypothetical protein [Spirulina sp. 06S082]|uniref:hypothetical protein n=1 Tax=Spirulina sp. 06S082 TaxID=3110248 RepID=UPI002B211C84|nr:hypothetical protein [Spirulina sp. 06S082]MEA5470088.1 hypothetical protein [Spirulina sp. 06S082]